MTLPGIPGQLLPRDVSNAFQLPVTRVHPGQLYIQHSLEFQCHQIPPTSFEQLSATMSVTVTLPEGYDFKTIEGTLRLTIYSASNMLDPQWCPPSCCYLFKAMSLEDTANARASSILNVSP